MRIGDRHCQLYTLADAEKLPGWCSPRITFDQYSTDKTKFPIGFSAGLGALLRCDHIYNQYIFLEDAPVTLKKLESKRLRLQSLSKASRENAIAEDSVNAFLNEAIKEQRLPVKFHANVFAWTENAEELPNLKNRVSSAIAQMEAIAAPGNGGRGADLVGGDSGQRRRLPDERDSGYVRGTGALFRGHGKPLPFFGRSEHDPLRRPDHRQAGPDGSFSRAHDAKCHHELGSFVCGGSGGGKSMLCNHIFRSLYDQGAHIVIVDIGGSYKGLVRPGGWLLFHL